MAADVVLDSLCVNLSLASRNPKLDQEGYDELMAGKACSSHRLSFWRELNAFARKDADQPLILQPIKGLGDGRLSDLQRSN